MDNVFSLQEEISRFESDVKEKCLVYRGLAQLVERLTLTQKVIGSRPMSSALVSRKLTSTRNRVGCRLDKANICDHLKSTLQRFGNISTLLRKSKALS